MDVLDVTTEDVKDKIKKNQSGNRYSKDVGDVELRGAAKWNSTFRTLLLEQGVSNIQKALLGNPTFEDLEYCANKKFLSSLKDSSVTTLENKNPKTQYLKNSAYNRLSVDMPSKQFMETLVAATNRSEIDKEFAASIIMEARKFFVSQCNSYFAQYDLLDDTKDVRAYNELCFGSSSVNISTLIGLHAKYPELSLWNTPIKNFIDTYAALKSGDHSKLDDYTKSLIDSHVLYLSGNEKQFIQGFSLLNDYSRALRDLTLNNKSQPLTKMESMFFSSIATPTKIFSKQYADYITASWSSDAGRKAYTIAERDIHDFSFLDAPKKNTSGERDVSSHRSDIVTIERKGNPLVAVNVTPDGLAKDWGLLGTQFGNTVNDRAGATFLNALYNDLLDFEKILHINLTDFFARCSDIAFAYGARGQGKKHKAHFEPSTLILAFTKDNGQGAVAHELAHLMDLVLSNFTYDGAQWKFEKPATVLLDKNNSDRYKKTYLSSIPAHLNAELISSLKALQTAMLYSDIPTMIPYKKPSTVYRFRDSAKNNFIRTFLTRHRDTFPEASTQERFDAVYSAFKNSFYKTVQIPPDVNNIIADVFYSTEKTSRFNVPDFRTSFYRASLDKNTPYWSSPCEMFARAFEVYCDSLMEKNGMDNNHLLSFPKDHELWPNLPHEKTAIVSAFDTLLDVIRKTYDLLPPPDRSQSKFVKDTSNIQPVKMVTDVNVTDIHISLQSQDELFPEYTKEEREKRELERKETIAHLNKPVSQPSLF